MMKQRPATQAGSWAFDLRARWCLAIPTTADANNCGHGQASKDDGVGGRLGDSGDVGPSGADAEFIEATFAAQTGTIYFSFLFRPESGAGADDFIQFSLNNDTDITSSGSIGDLSTTSGANRFAARIGGANGGTSVNSPTSLAKRQAEHQNERQQRALGILAHADHALIGTKYSVRDFYGPDEEGLLILQNATGFRLTSLGSPARESDLTDDEVKLLKDALLGVYAYAPPCMCTLEPNAQLLVSAPGGSRRYLLQYSAHLKIHAVGGDGFRMDLSEAGKHLFLKIHHAHFPEDRAWEFVKLTAGAANGD
jgi:hypothetical protein